MRSQTTLEFLILLSAAASLSVFAIGTYSNIANAQKPFYKLLEQSPAANQVSNVPIRQNSTDGIYASIANVTYVNRSNSLEVIVTSSSIRVAEVRVVGSPNVAIVPSQYDNVSISGLSILPFSVIPKAAGIVAINAVADFYGTNESASISAYAESYAVPSNTNGTSEQGPEFAASLARRNESIMYPIGAGTDTYTASMWSHCSDLDWGHNEMPMAAQCGDANWYFWEFDSNCYFNQGIYYITYCVKLYPTNTTASIIRGTQSYGYNASLLLYNGTDRFSADLNNLKNASQLYDSSGMAEGNVIVSEVSGVGSQQYNDYVVLNTSGNTRPINISYYDNYLQYLNGLEAFLNYYGTGADPGTATQDISYLNSGASNLMAAPSAKDAQCRIMTEHNQSYYSCDPVSGLYYTINASISSSKSLNQSIVLQGSTINIR